MTVDRTDELSVMPLRGRRVVVTRPTERAGAFAEQLRNVEAVPVLVSLTRIVPPADDGPLRRAAETVAQYDWIVFTSVNAVQAFAAVLPSRPRDALRGRIAAVGPRTALAVADLLRRDVAVMPTEFSGAALADALVRAGPLAGVSVLWPRAEAALDSMGRRLTESGARLDAPVAYRTECDPAAAHALSQLVQERAIDVLTFAAPTAVSCYTDAVGATGDSVVAVIGTTTADAAREHGMTVHIQPAEHTTAALVAELNAHFAQHIGS